MARRFGTQYSASFESPGDGSAAHRTRLLALPAAIFALLALPAEAAEWEVIPTLSVLETYTDNVALAPKDARESEWITQLLPGISINATGPRLRLEAKYEPEILYYAEKTSEDAVFHRGSALGKLELAEKLLFLDAGARIDQYNVSLQDPLTFSNVNITSNRATVATSYVSPYLQRDFGSAARAEARFTYSTLKTDDPEPALPDNDGRSVELRLKSGPARKVLTWEAAYEGQSIRYDTSQETITQVFTVTGRQLITPTVGLLAQAGYETFDTGAPEKLEDPRYSAGFDWTPTPRTRLAATAGQRLGDDTYSFDFRHRTRRTTWTASYNEDVTTTRSQFFLPEAASTAGALDPLFQSQFPDPVDRQKAIDEFIARSGLPPSLGAPVNFFSDQLFLHKRWLASVVLQGVRNTLAGRVFWESRTQVTGAATLPVAGDFAVSESIEEAGASVTWSLRLAPRSTWNVEAVHIRSQFVDTDRIDDFTYLRAGFTHQFQPRVAGALYYRLQYSEGYTENSATASLSVRF
jgi:uncharacterized protein (PEP-CTERM system associated)